MLKPVTILLCILLSGCGPIGGALISGLAGSGPSLDAQIGKENNRNNTINVRPVARDQIGSSVTSETATINNTNFPTWFIVALIIAAVWPSPIERIINYVKNFRKSK